jgi:hypothetical protein
MIITNKNRLPEPLFRAVSRQRNPTPDSISVTQLISPPQIRVLTLRHWDALEEDAADRLWAAVGSLMHTLLEGHGKNLAGHQAERTLETEVEGMKVTGTFDLFVEDGTVSDYKFVSVWSTMDGLKPEWEQQLNLYAELLRRAGERVDRLQIVVIYRDWSKGKANDPSYPSSQVRIYNVPLWEPARAIAFLLERVRMHVDAQHGGETFCTPEERWARAPKFALMKQGNKKATKLYDSETEAAEAAANGKNLYVQPRPGAQVRCESYCAVARFFPQFALIKALEGEE